MHGDPAMGWSDPALRHMCLTPSSSSLGRLAGLHSVEHAGDRSFVLHPIEVWMT